MYSNEKKKKSYPKVAFVMFKTGEGYGVKKWSNVGYAYCSFTRFKAPITAPQTPLHAPSRKQRKWHEKTITEPHGHEKENKLGRHVSSRLSYNSISVSVVGIQVHESQAVS